MKQLFKIALAMVNIAFAVAILTIAVTSTLNAAKHPVEVIATMSFPFWVVLGLILLIADFFVLRKWCILIGGCFALTLPLALNVIPLNLSTTSVPTQFRDKAWTLMTYNVSNFQDLTGEYADSLNPALQYILKEKPDVAVLEEGRWLTEVKGFHIDSRQLKEIHEAYPYVIVGQDITLLSKFPAEEITLSSFPNQVYHKSLENSKAACFIVDVEGVKTAIVGVHLKSLGLTRDDKNLYGDFTRGEGFTSRTEITEAKNDLIAKIAKANRARANHLDALIDDINKLDYENIIVCGDFNDTPGCYSLNELRKDGFHETYPLVGCGYSYTFNSDRLLFRIDHVLFKGNLRAWDLQKGKLRTSDHYPLLTTFVPRINK